MQTNLKMYQYLIAILVVSSVKSQEPLIEISQGTLRGLALENKDGDIVYGFKSIPYAKPPINELRFKVS